MKILHTSDWHLGCELWGYDRLDEYARALHSIVDVVRQCQPDAVIVAGDVFDNSQPSAAAQSVFADVIMDITKAAPGITVVVTAGNHDSASRHEVSRLPWSLADVRMVGVIPPADKPEDIIAKLIIPVRDKGFIVALPYAGRRLNAQPELPAMLLDHVAALNTEGLPVVMTAHLPVANADFGAHRRRDDDSSVGNVDTVPLDSLGRGYDYLALGHIHKAQTFDGAHVSYCGTPVHTSFDESGPRHVNIVDIAAYGAQPHISHIDIPAPAELVTIPAEGSARWDVALALLADIDPERDCYVRLCVSDDGSMPPDAKVRAAAVCAGKKCRFCYINVVRTDTGAADDDAAQLSVESFIAAAPDDIARRYYSLRGLCFDEDTRALFDSVVDEINNEDSL